MNTTEQNAWTLVKEVIVSFLGKDRKANSEEIVWNMLKSFEKQNVNMSLKIHFLKSHLEFFPSQFSSISDEHGERFHQTMQIIEKLYQGRADPHMLADFCWRL